MSLIELVIGIAIMSVLLAAGVPNFSSWIRNNQIRDAATAIQTGLNLARLEAVRRNAPVRFTLGANGAWSMGCDTAVDDLDEDGVADCPASIEAQPAGGSNPRVATSQVAASGGAVANDPVFTSALVFNGMGRIGASLPAGQLAVFNISNPGGGSCAPDGPMRCLRIVVSTAGQVRMCDPAAAAGDPKGC